MGHSANLDKFDTKILELLQREGRLSNVDLADKIGLSESPCLRRVRRLESEGIIRGYGARLDRAAVGLALTAFVEVTVSRHSIENAAMVQARLRAISGCVACHMVSGAADFLMELVVPDLASYERILSAEILTMDVVASVRSNFSLRAVLTDAPLKLAEM